MLESLRTGSFRGSNGCPVIERLHGSSLRGSNGCPVIKDLCGSSPHDAGLKEVEFDAKDVRFETHFRDT